MTKIRRIKFGKDNAVELATRKLRLVAVVSRGPRIAFFGKPGGENLFYWSPGRHRRGKWDLMGGHRLWLTRPGADECEETYRPDNAPCAVEITRGGFTVVAPVDAENKIQRGFRVRVLGEDRIEVEHFVRNTGDMLWSGGLWAMSCTAPHANTTYSIPLGDRSAWDYATIVAFNTWGGGHGGEGYEDSQFSFTRDQFVLRPSGRENKRMVKADAGIMAMHDPARGTLFAKQSPFCPHANYPLGTNLAVYVGPKNFMVEMESMSPFITLKPGESTHHTETWLLRPAGAKPHGASALRQLFAKR